MSVLVLGGISLILAITIIIISTVSTYKLLKSLEYIIEYAEQTGRKQIEVYQILIDSKIRGDSTAKIVQALEVALFEKNEPSTSLETEK